MSEAQRVMLEENRARRNSVACCAIRLRLLMNAEQDAAVVRR